MTLDLRETSYAPMYTYYSQQHAVNYSRNDTVQFHKSLSVARFVLIPL